MPPPYTLDVLSRTTSDDGIGGSISSWTVTGKLLGYIDLLAGTDQPTGALDNAFVENSTHIAIIPGGGSATDEQLLRGPNGKVYDITYVDDPLGVGHHLEIYLRLGGGTDGATG